MPTTVGRICHKNLCGIFNTELSASMWEAYLLAAVLADCGIVATLLVVEVDLKALEVVTMGMALMAAATAMKKAAMEAESVK
jgi:hypothetical protein